jgi:hypothetical protein
VLIGRNLEAVGRTEGIVLTAFTDGCPGLRRILADAGVTERPMLDWSHIGMLLQHLKQIASWLPADDPARVAAKAAIVADVEQLHWRIWNGKAKTLGKASTVFALSCIISSVNRVAESPSRPLESCGPPCRRWMVISLARATGWSITPNAIVADCALELRSPKGPPIFW